MSKVRDYNISYIGYGDVIDDTADLTAANIFSKSWTEIGNLVDDTIKDVAEEATETDFKNAENDKIDFSVISEEAVKKFEFATMNQKMSNKILAFGGSVTDGIWSAPVQAYNGIEKALIIISRSVDGKKAYKVFPRVKMTAMTVGEYNGTEVNAIMFKITVLSPQTSAGVQFQNELNFFRAVAPVTATYTGTSLTWDYVQGFDAATDYEYSEDSGSNWLACSANPQTVTGSLGSILLRTEAYTSSDLDEAQWQFSESLTVTETV